MNMDMDAYAADAEWLDENRFPDSKDIDEAVERGVEVDASYDRIGPGHYVVMVDLADADAERLGIDPTVRLSVTPATITLLYNRVGGSHRELHWEPAEDEAQALAYRHALTHPEDEALSLAEAASVRDDAEAETA